MRLLPLLILLISCAQAVEVEPARPIRGTLFIHGGGDSLVEQFVKFSKAEDTKLVVIGGSDKGWSKRGFAKVDVLKNGDDSKDFISPLREAGAVWISDDATSYVGTPVEAELHALLKRGGLIGGGKSLGKLMIRDDEKTVPGYDLIQGAIIDQPSDSDKRLTRLRGAIADHPNLVGYGINEGAAMVLRGRRISFLGRSSVTICLAKSESRKESLRVKRPRSSADHIASSRAAIERAANLKFVEKPIMVENGTVIAIGGGSTPRSGLEHFIKSAGGKEARIVSFYTASSDNPTLSRNWRRRWESVGARNVKALHASDLTEANSAEFIKEIDAASGVWFGGGRQWRLVDRYLGTETEAAIRRVLERGGVVGGSSAGASILGEYMVRGNPLGSRTMMEEGYERGLNLVPGAGIDQHFSQRQRFRDMAAFKKAYPQLNGFGIDEGTAIAFRKGGCEVFGKGKVFFYPVGGETIELEAGDQLDFDQ